MGIERIVKGILRVTRGKNIEPIIHPVIEKNTGRKGCLYCWRKWRLRICNF